MKLKWSLLAAALSIAIAFSAVEIVPGNLTDNAVPTFTDRILIKGSTGNDVRELQGRLQLLGFYKGRVDGVFGWTTYWAVRNFQDRFGMKIDGRVGVRTRERLVAATKSYNPWNPPRRTAQQNIPRGRRAARGGRQGRAAAPARQQAPRVVHANSRISANDLKLVSNAVHGESRGEPYIGQVAVAAVIFNRLEHPQFPNTIPGIIFQPGAFTAVADGQIWLQPNAESTRAVTDALNGWDPSGGAIYYFNPATATSKWIWGRPQIKRIGQHIFCR